jgi:hypothetical protein
MSVGHKIRIERSFNRKTVQFQPMNNDAIFAPYRCHFDMASNQLLKKKTFSSITWQHSKAAQHRLQARRGLFTVSQVTIQLSAPVSSKLSK